MLSAALPEKEFTGGLGKRPDYAFFDDRMRSHGLRQIKARDLPDMETPGIDVGKLLGIKFAAQKIDATGRNLARVEPAAQADQNVWTYKVGRILKNETFVHKHSCGVIIICPLSVSPKNQTSLPSFKLSRYCSTVLIMIFFPFYIDVMISCFDYSVTGLEKI